jgi:hypothetical protein
MEPVFMVLGQSAATAASLAIDAGVPVQKIDFAALRTRLEADGQILNYTAPPKPAANFIPLDSLKGIVVDDIAAKLSGEWLASVLTSGIHQGYRHDNDARDGLASATFTATLPASGDYEVQVAWSPNANRATNVPVKIEHAGGVTEVKLNQRERPEIDRLFGSVGRFRFDGKGVVTISNAATDGHVVIDAVRWVRVE